MTGTDERLAVAIRAGYDAAFPQAPCLYPDCDCAERVGDEGHVGLVAVTAALATLNASAGLSDAVVERACEARQDAMADRYGVGIQRMLRWAEIPECGHKTGERDDMRAALRAAVPLLRAALSAAPPAAASGPSAERAPPDDLRAKLVEAARCVENWTPEYWGTFDDHLKKMAAALATFHEGERG